MKDKIYFKQFIGDEGILITCTYIEEVIQRYNRYYSLKDGGETFTPLMTIKEIEGAMKYIFGAFEYERVICIGGLYTSVMSFRYEINRINDKADEYFKSRINEQKNNQ